MSLANRPFVLAKADQTTLQEFGLGISEPADSEREVCVIAGILSSHRTLAFFITLPLLEPRNQISA
ncbi:hypothetical protein PENSTE_c004G06760 [Penicillium steckii]|uniref:Uncharacterized protein n=1 Tax=Penicillium steckii TaxID=303698 RepID=A0A1V6TMC7_9EURO|nr:hypothetical protein PENSTE_c004G06760 [Penicillium steckii]